MTITQYNSKKAHTWVWMSFLRKKNLDELINIPTKAEERSMTQISFRTPEDPNIKTGSMRNPRQNSGTADPRSTVLAGIRSTYRKNPQSMRQIRWSENLFTPILVKLSIADFTWRNNIYHKSGI